MGTSIFGEKDCQRFLMNHHESSKDFGFLKNVIPSPLDIQAIRNLDQSHMAYPWSDQSWAELNDEFHHLIVAKKNNDLLGFALFFLVPGDELAHLLKIVVAPKHQGKGFSIDFWHYLERYLQQFSVKKVFLEVETENEKAKKFYLKCGFQHLRIIKGFYHQGKDAQTMLCHFPSFSPS